MGVKCDFLSIPSQKLPPAPPPHLVIPKMGNELKSPPAFLHSNEGTSNIFNEKSTFPPSPLDGGVVDETPTGGWHSRLEGVVMITFRKDGSVLTSPLLLDDAKKEDVRLVCSAWFEDSSDGQLVLGKVHDPTR